MAGGAPGRFTRHLGGARRANRRSLGGHLGRRPPLPSRRHRPPGAGSPPLGARSAGAGCPLPAPLAGRANRIHRRLEISCVAAVSANSRRAMACDRGSRFARRTTARASESAPRGPAPTARPRGLEEASGRLHRCEGTQGRKARLASRLGGRRPPLGARLGPERARQSRGRHSSQARRFRTPARRAPHARRNHPASHNQSSQAQICSSRSRASRKAALPHEIRCVTVERPGHSLSGDIGSRGDRGAFDPKEEAV